MDSFTKLMQPGSCGHRLTSYDHMPIYDSDSMSGDGRVATPARLLKGSFQASGWKLGGKTDKDSPPERWEKKSRRKRVGGGGAVSYPLAIFPIFRKKSQPTFFLYPVLPFLVFLEFLVFFCCEDFLVFLCVFRFFSRDFRGLVGIKNPCFFGGFPCRFPKKKGKEGQGISLFQTSS